MPTLVATPKSTTANSYATVADADTYFDERLNSSNWTGAVADDKARALIMATRRIDSEEFYGYKTTDGQALKWPREGAYNDDDEEYDTDTVPAIVEQATYELAVYLLNSGTSDPFVDTGLEEYKRVKVGQLEVERSGAFRAAKLPENVYNLLRPVISTARNSIRLHLS